MNTEMYRHELKVYAEKLIAGHDEFMAAIKDRRSEIADVEIFQDQEARHTANYKAGVALLRITETASDTAIFNKVTTFVGKCAINMMCRISVGAIQSDALKAIVDRLFSIMTDYDK